jgi:hypothetical protein
MNNDKVNIHAIWHDFCEKFGEGTMGDNFYNLCGHEKMEEIEEWAKKHPEVIITRCDDNHHDTSYLVIIPHPTHGISIVFVPQATYSKDYFFLYPNHQKALIKALQSIEIKDKYAIEDYDEEGRDPENLNFKKFVEKEKGEE